MTDINKLEQRMAKSDGGRAVKNSGRGMNKGDAVVGDLLVDYKFTDSDSFSLNINKFTKHLIDAVKANREPAIIVVFQQHKGKRVAIVDADYLLDLEQNGKASV